MKDFEFLNEEFLSLVDEIMRRGQVQHGAKAVNPKYPCARPKGVRWKKSGLMAHSRRHATDYENGVPHDHFGTLEHQLAAIAANALLEFSMLRHEQGKR